MQPGKESLSQIIDNELAVTIDAVKYRAKDLGIPKTLIMSSIAHEMLSLSTSILLLLGVADTIVKKSMNDKINSTIKEQRENKCH